MSSPKRRHLVPAVLPLLGAIALSAVVGRAQPNAAEEARLKKLDAEMGYPRSYADYMFRILTSMKLDRVVYIEQYGGRWGDKTEDLPHVEMGNSWSNNDLIKQLEKMQDDLCGRFKRPIGSLNNA